MMPDCANCPCQGQPRIGPTPSVLAVPRYIIVAESPGRTEMMLGEVLVGPTGRKLDYVLKAAGIDRQDCYLTNVVKCFPPDKKSKKKAASCCLPILHDEIEALVKAGCRDILAFGEISAHALTGDCTPLSDWHGHWYPGPFETRVHVLYHPAFTLASRRPAMTIPLIMDIRHITASGPSLPEVAPSISLDHLRAAPQICVDVENDVTGLKREEMDPRKDPLLLVGAGTREGAVCIHWPLRPEESNIWDVIRQKLEDPSVVKIGQNFVHDILSLKYKAGIKVKGPCEDLMIGHAAKFPALDHDLGAIYAQYYWNKRWKNFANDDFEGYNLLDVHRTANAWDQVSSEIDAAYPRCHDYYRQAVHLDLDVGRRMREVGILTSSSERERLFREQTTLKEAAEKRFHELCPGIDLGQDGNTGALRRLFFNTLGVKPLEYSDGGEPSMNGFLLRWCKLNAPNHIATIAAALLAFKEPSKRLSTYLKGKYVDDDGAIHANWASSWRAINGRWASRKPNLQNVPPCLRSMFVARSGKVLVEFDYAQIELWFQALYSQDNELLDWHDAGVDIHTENAKKLVGWREDQPAAVRKSKRDGMKNGAYGLFYNFSSDITAVMASFWRKGIEMKKTEIEALRKIWFGGRPKLAAGQKYLVAQAERNGYSESFGGRRFYFFGGEVDKNQALNLPISSSVGDLMNDSIAKVSAMIDWKETNILAQVHDSILMETTPEALPRLKEGVLEIMQQKVEVRGRSIVFKADVKTGLNWGAMKSSP